MQKLIIVRGLPGSGKSTKANELRDTFIKDDKTVSEVLEADSFFTNKSGEYLYDPHYLPRAHEWCFNNAVKSVIIDKNDVTIVANTFTTNWEMKDYRMLAFNAEIECEIIECQGDYGSVHGVPFSVMSTMKERWEEVIDIKDYD